MRKKLAAILTIAIFLVGVLAIAKPVQAVYTLGNLNGNYPYHFNDYDPHVSGFIGYVWPGGGSDAYSGAFGLKGPQANINAAGGFSPGYITPFPHVPPASGSMVCNGSPCPESWYQLAGNSYSPFGAILAGSSGDLIFALNHTAFASTTSDKWTKGWAGLTILIPPEFKVPGPEQVSDTWSNDYQQIYVYKLAQDDRYAPGWTAVTLWTDAYQGGEYGTQCTAPTCFESHSNQFLNFTSAGEWYYARINGVGAPSVAGRYFFKMALLGDSAGAGATPPTWIPPSSGGLKGLNVTQFVPAQNWPVLLVKGEIDPAILTGTIRYGGYNSTMYGQPVDMAGRVWAEMTTKYDPYHPGASVATCPPETSPGVPAGGATAVPGCYDSAGYFNETAHGHYEVEGLAPGVYDLYAEAAGYPQMLCESGVTVLAGQSLHFDCYLQPGVVIHGNVFTKHQFGDEPWPVEDEAKYIKIELYANATLTNKVDPSAGPPVSWSPIPCVAGGQAGIHVYGATFYDDQPAGSYSMIQNDASGCGDPATASNIGFPWTRYGGINYQGDTYGPSFGGWSTVQLAQPNLPTVNTQDPLGVGPPQKWVVQSGTTTPFHFEFGVKGEFGAPRDVDGHVPEVYATWVNGLTPGRYYVRAWTFRYVQTALDGATFQEYYFDVTPNEWAGDVTLPIDLRLSSWVNKTVYFHDTPGTISTNPIRTGGTYLAGVLLGADGHVYSFNYTTMTTTDTRFCQAYSVGECTIQFWGINSTWIGQNYGIPSGTYTPKVAAAGYIGTTPLEEVSVTLSGNPTQVSDHLWLGPGFNVTVYSIDWERPQVPRHWIYPGMHIQVAYWLNGSLQDVADQGDYGDIGTLNGVATPPVQNNNLNYAVVVGSGCGGLTGTALSTCVWKLGYFGEDSDHWVGGEIGDNGIWLQSDAATDGSFAGELATHFQPGLYTLTGTTYGYIQDQVFSAFAQPGQLADIRINLVEGVNVSLTILFKKESIITPTTMNMSARVRLFDDSNKLVADYMTSEGVYSDNNTVGLSSGHVAAADGEIEPSVTGGPFPDTIDFSGRTSGFDNYPALGSYSNYLPGGVTLFHVQLGGRSLLWNSFEGDYLIDPVFGPSSIAELGGVEASGTTNAGIPGAPDYQGGWTAEVDFVPWYLNNTADTFSACVTGTTSSCGGVYYPPVNGLLMGESYHIIPGTTATSGISLTEDGALNGPYLKPGHSMAPNHLGPYSQEGVWQIAGAHNSGEASAIFEVDLNGFVSGNAYAMSYVNEWRPTSWAAITVAPVTGTGSWNFYTYDGIYQAYLPTGNYKFTISEPGLAAQSWSVSISPGQVGTGQNVYLQESQIPVPEFSTIGLVAFSALAASVYLLKRRRK